MSHIGIICPPVSGHLNPMIVLGNELHQRGHQVTLFGILDAQSHAQAAGLSFRSFGRSEFPLGTTAESSAVVGKLSGIDALNYTINWIKNLTKVQLRDIPSALKEAGVEVLLVDQIAPEGATIAEILSIPFVTVCNALLINQEDCIPPLFTTWNYSQDLSNRWRNRITYFLLNYLTRPVRQVVNEYRQTRKLSRILDNPDSFSSRIAIISQQPSSFEFPRKSLPKHFHFTGPFLNPALRKSVDFPFEKLTGQPIIYASLGTVQNRLLWIFQTIAEACLGIDAQLVISLGGSEKPESLPELPGKPIVVEFAPQLKLLQKASLTITHAGLNTVLESLSNGVPMVAIPITNDQPGVAARIVWTGTGELVQVRCLSTSRLRNVIKKVLNENFYKQNALKLQTAIHSNIGVSCAANIVEQAASTGLPVLACTHKWEKPFK